jgi:integrative and conjugative element protein (TIGR02256 family)
MSLSWRCRDFRQVLVLSDEVLSYVRAHRQLEHCANEAGGQLFGVVSPQEVLITVATGPYAADTRSRFSYRSSPQAANAAIETQEGGGLSYLGEWHTHAEGRPTPSSYDKATMSAISKKSTLRAGAAMMLIVGQSETLEGLYVGTFENGKFHRWVADADSKSNNGLMHRLWELFR